MRTCLRCSSPLSPRMRSDVRYCSTRCRVAAHRAKATVPALPLELVNRARWIRYTARKVPLTAWDTPASSTDPSTWTDYEAARESSAGVGLGFVLNGDGIVCLDLDGCFVDGELTAFAAELVRRCGDTYVERSPSGNGLHIWGRARLPYGGRVFDAVEVYGNGRYLTVTGDALTSSRRLGPLSKVIAAL